MSNQHGREILNWELLPSELQYFAAPAEKYGRLQFDDRIYAFLTEDATAADLAELKALSQAFETDGSRIEEWLNQYNMKAHPEARLVYFMQHLVGTACDIGRI